MMLDAALSIIAAFLGIFYHENMWNALPLFQGYIEILVAYSVRLIIVVKPFLNFLILNYPNNSK